MNDRVAVLVPVLRRPQNAAPFVRSLRASTAEASVYAVADSDDPETIAAWQREDVCVLVRRADGRPGTFAQKINRGYLHTGEPWLFLAGDDVRFERGWLAEAQRVAADTGASVIGTNDLGNGRVIAGDHATHMLIRRSYVDQQGASWDGPRVVCHEGYRHWYVDDEIVVAAKQRGTWAAAPSSVVEHLHPVWGKALDDDVYQLGQSWAGADGALFERRRAIHAP